MRPHLILSATLLAFTLLGSGTAFANHVEDHYTKGELKTACDSAGGATTNESNGSYMCSFTDGGYIECNKKQNCVGGYSPPAKLIFGALGKPKIEGNSTDGGGKFGGVRASITNANEANPDGGQVHVTTDPSGPPAGNSGHKGGIGKIVGLGNQG